MRNMQRTILLCLSMLAMLSLVQTPVMAHAMHTQMQHHVLVSSSAVHTGMAMEQEAVDDACTPTSCGQTDGCLWHCLDQARTREQQWALVLPLLVDRPVPFGYQSLQPAGRLLALRTPTYTDQLEAHRTVQKRE